ncbi:TIM44-like domain-containing protein [Colwellia sp. 75C3]|uniref:TIM44-like domain-containing protein n=1 Tax=Colwellia sp. 75C3 TaxID=888425 RepID=UPI0012FEFE14|nr:TIM44-like domain-containing protein [Colwellia sp. 75C3]
MFTFFFVLSLSFIIYRIYKSSEKKQHNVVHKVISRGVKKQNKNKQQTQHNKIIALDPDFDKNHMITRVEKAFFIIKEAWSKHDMSSARGFITDGIFQRYVIQFTIQKKHQRHRKIDDLSINHCELVGIEADKFFETLHFKISSQARLITEKTNRTKHPHKLPPYTYSVEYWTYIRLPGVKTRSQPGLIEGICPNCGATLLLSKFEQCQACNSLVTSGEYDWILAKITQEEEWRFQNAKRQIKGVAEYQVVDAAFNLPVIEDRVSVIFWRLQKAWLSQNSAPIQPIAHATYVDYFNKNELKNHYFDDVELGLCEVSSVEFGDEFDKVFVLVKWKATKVSFEAKVKSITGYYAHHLTLIRKNGVLSNTKKGLHSLHCYSCGAPQSESYHDSCQYCHSTFNHGELDWVLNGFTPHINRVVQLKGKSFSIESGPGKSRGQIFDPISLLSGLVLILLADGKAHPKEIALLSEFSRKRKIPQHVLDEVMLAGENGELKMLAPDEALDASAWLIKMIEMCLIDGEISKKEHELLILFGKKFNILAIEIDIRIKETRTKLYLDAKLALAPESNVS